MGYPWMFRPLAARSPVLRVFSVRGWLNPQMRNLQIQRADYNQIQLILLYFPYFVEEKKDMVRLYTPTSLQT